MATRQRARSTRKAPPLPVQSPADGDIGRTAADVPGIDQTSSSQGSTQDTGNPQVHFVGEQIVYKSREERIAESAYLYAEGRGFAPGYEIEDWLKAEKEIDALLAGNGYQAD